MFKPFPKEFVCFAASAAVCLQAVAQAPNVPVYKQGHQESRYEEEVRQAAREIFAESNAVKLATVKEQLKRADCQLDLPRAKTAKLPPRDICIAARRSHLRVGWFFLCEKCNDWHVSLAGGYVLTADGVVVTCCHVVQPESRMKDGCLIAADEDAKVFPVTEVLAANRASEVCIIRVAGTAFRPLPLNTNVYPGDLAWCYSDPVGHRGFFSQGIVNRFYQAPRRRSAGAASASDDVPTRIDVSTDWAPGSSGSAVLDECGNVIGHVSTISAINETMSSDVSQSQHTNRPTMIVFHEAVSARDVLRLIRRPGQR